MSAYEYTSVVTPQHTEDVISIPDTRMKNNQWESSVKTVQEACHMGILTLKNGYACGALNGHLFKEGFETEKLTRN